MRIERAKLEEDIRLLIEQCVTLKRVLRTTWTRPMAEEQRRLARARRRVTDLFILKAHLRGKQHVLHLLAEDHARIAELAAAGYRLEDEVSP